MSQSLEINHDALDPLLELLEHKGVLSWSDRVRVGSSPDYATGLLDALEAKRMLTWSAKVALNDFASLLSALEQQRLITWSERVRLGMADEAGQRTGGRGR